MMNILFLDDSPSRHDFVCKKKHNEHTNKTHRLHVNQTCVHETCTIFHAYKISDAIECFEKDTDIYFDLVCLDHDLFIPSEKLGLAIHKCEVGTDMAKYMADNYDKLEDRIGKIIIHSWNAPGAKNMEAILRDAGYTDILRSPFSVA